MPKVSHGTHYRPFERVAQSFGHQSKASGKGNGAAQTWCCESSQARGCSQANPIASSKQCMEGIAPVRTQKGIDLSQFLLLIVFQAKERELKTKTEQRVKKRLKNAREAMTKRNSRNKNNNNNNNKNNNSNTATIFQTHHIHCYNSQSK
jgi:hypothetical protein